MGSIIPAARITGEALVRPRGVKEMEDRETTGRGKVRRIFKAELPMNTLDDIPSFYKELVEENDRLRQELQQAQAREGAYLRVVEAVQDLRKTWQVDFACEAIAVGFVEAQKLDEAITALRQQALSAGEGGASCE